MIAYLPAFKESQLFYSWLGNLYLENGFGSFETFANEVFGSYRYGIDTDYINQLNPNFFNLLLSNFNVEDLVLEHTLFKWFARFVGNKERNEGFKELMQNGGRIKSCIPTQRDLYSKGRNLKYCNCCSFNCELPFYLVEHQIPEITRCSKCGEKLISSPVKARYLNFKAISPLIETVGFKKPFRLLSFEKRDINYEISKYCAELLKQPLIMKSKSSIAQFLTSKLYGTKYIKGRGGKKNLQMFYEDIMRFYEKLENNPLTKQHINFIFRGLMTDSPFEIVLISYYLGISANELSEYGKAKIVDEKEKINKQIHKLHKEGMNNQRIAEKLNLSRETIRKEIKGEKL